MTLGSWMPPSLTSRLCKRKAGPLAVRADMPAPAGPRHRAFPSAEKPSPRNAQFKAELELGLDSMLPCHFCNPVLSSGS